jgi:hypothetical protein
LDGTCALCVYVSLDCNIHNVWVHPEKSRRNCNGQ